MKNTPNNHFQISTVPETMNKHSELRYTYELQKPWQAEDEHIFKQPEEPI